MIEAALTRRLQDELGVRYALQVDWTSGASSRTELVPWDALAGFQRIPHP